MALCLVIRIALLGLPCEVIGLCWAFSLKHKGHTCCNKLGSAFAIVTLGTLIPFKIRCMVKSLVRFYEVLR